MIVSTFGKRTVLPCGTTSVSGMNPLERVLMTKRPGLGFGLPAFGKKYTRPSLTSPAVTDCPCPATNFRLPLMLPTAEISACGASSTTGLAMGAGGGLATGVTAGFATSTGATTATGAGSGAGGTSVRGSGAAAGSGIGMAVWIGSAACGTASLAWPCGLLLCCVGAELHPTSVSSSPASAVR